MKKLIIFMMLILTFGLTSCDINLNPGVGDSSNDEEKTSETETFKKGTVPLYKEEKIKNNIGSYSQSFKITNYDAIYEFDVKFDASTSTGIVNRKESTTQGVFVSEQEYFFTRGNHDEYVVYYENDYGYGYLTEYSLQIDYMNTLFDISRDLIHDAPYASKTELTYANRKATKYVVSNPDYILPADTILNIILDDETGAILSLTYNYLNLYESTSFVPNDNEASTSVLAKKDTLAFDFINKEALELLKLGNISIPDWYYYDATYMCLDNTSTDVSNMYSYSVQFYENMENNDPIKELCHYLYDNGVKYDYDGVEKSYEELYEERDVYIDTNIRIAELNGYITIGEVTYNVVLQGKCKTSDGNDWYISLIITVKE